MKNNNIIFIVLITLFWLLLFGCINFNDGNKLNTEISNDIQNDKNKKDLLIKPNITGKLNESNVLIELSESNGLNFTNNSKSISKKNLILIVLITH